MDAAEYKHIVLGLIFLKYISDTFVKQQDKVKSMVSEPSSDYFISEDPAEYAEELEERDYYIQDNVFWVPQEARWETLRSKAKQPDTKHTLPFQSIQCLISSIGDALNFTSYHVFNETTLYEQTITNIGSDGIALINRLKETNDHQRHHQRQTQQT